MSSEQAGVTTSLLDKPPTARDIQLSEELEKELRSHGIYESEEENKKRLEVLAKLDLILKEFVRRCCIEQGKEEQAQLAGGKIFTFGSYRLGVHSRGGDIDTLCVVPRNISREMFFSTMHEMMRKRPEVTNLVAVPDAHVPVMTFIFDGIDIDLLFARMEPTSIPDDFSLKDDYILRNLDDESVRSVNGSRVTDMILELCPNVESFRTALRCIKLWAKRRGIYSNKFGFFGGVAMAMLVCRITQLVPKGSPATIVRQFFRILEMWQWPNPILLCEVKRPPGLSLTVWDPKENPQDYHHLFPVITPAYPSMNSMYNVSKSTLKILKDEFTRGRWMTEQIELGKLVWKDLLEPTQFFARFKTYLRCEVVAQTEDDFRAWSGLSQARLRFLVQSVENDEKIEGAYPFPQAFDNTSQMYKHSVSWFIGLWPAPRNGRQPRSTDLGTRCAQIVNKLKSWKGFKNGMDVFIYAMDRLELPEYVFPDGKRIRHRRKQKEYPPPIGSAPITTGDTGDSATPAATSTTTAAGAEGATGGTKRSREEDASSKPASAGVSLPGLGPAPAAKGDEPPSKVAKKG